MLEGPWPRLGDLARSLVEQVYRLVKGSDVLRKQTHRINDKVKQMKPTLTLNPTSTASSPTR